MNNALFLQAYSDAQLQQLRATVRRELARHLRQRRAAEIDYLAEIIMELDKDGLGPPDLLLAMLVKRLGCHQHESHG